MTFTAGTAIPAYRIVRLSATGQAEQATAAADRVIGASPDLAVVAGERVDVFMSGVAYLTAGAAITPGALVMSDASGRAITAAAAAGVNVRAVGVALEAAGAAGDVIACLMEPGTFQG